MARTVDRSDLRTRARTQANLPSTTFVSDSEVNEMINASLGIWHGKIVRAVPDRYEAEDTITADGSSSYALPSDYYGTLGLEYQDGDTRIELPRSMFRERNRWGSPTTTGVAQAYRLVGSTVVLLPNPSSGDYVHYYVTAAPALTDDVTTVDGYNGWEEWIVLDVAVKMKAKQEADSVAVLIRERDAIALEIDSVANQRELAEPNRILQTRNRTAWRPGWYGHDKDFWFGR